MTETAAFTARRLHECDHEDAAQADCAPAERWAIWTDVLRGEHAAALSRWERFRGEEDGRREQAALLMLLAAEEAEDDGRATTTPPADLSYAGHMTPATAVCFGVEPGTLVHYTRSHDDVEPWTRDIWIAETGEHIGCSAVIGDAIQPAA